MRHLYKTSATIGAIIVIEVLKKISEAIWVYRPFHTFFTSLQFVLLLWLAVSLIFDLTIFRKLPANRSVRRTILLVFILLVIGELFTSFLLHHPRHIPKQALTLFRGYYDIFDRNIIQFNPNSGRYDSSLFYTLTPGKRFAFNNLEFNSEYSTNTKGLRDDEWSLQKPDIIVLGDSYAMGWGVQQNETFAEQLEEMTGKKVLNAAISSYGTARELENLYRLDTSELQYLIIQYCKNDSPENKQFLENNRLPISPRAAYDTAVQFEYWSKQYFPGKHFTTITKWYLKNSFNAIGRHIFPKPARSTESLRITVEEEAQNFLDILYRSPLNFKKLKVLVLDINDQSTINDRFVEQAETLKHQFKYEHKFKTNLVFVPVSKLFDKEDYYILDPHLRPSGHRKIAHLLRSYLTSESFHH